MSEISSELLEWVQIAVNAELEAYGEHQRMSSIFFGTADGQEHTVVIDIPEEEFAIDDFLDEARTLLSRLPALQKYAVAWIGEVELDDDQPVKAVLVHASLRDQNAVVMAQPYKRNRLGTVVATGELCLVAENENSLVDDSTDADGGGQMSEEDSQRMDQLVAQAAAEVLRRLAAGDQRPLAYVSYADEDAGIGLYEPEIEEGEFCDLVNSVRSGVCSDEDGYQYAVAYLGTDEVDGKLIEGMYIEAGDVNGHETTYFKRYTETASGTIQPAEDTEVFETGTSLWCIEDDESTEEDVERPLNDLIEPVFSMAVERLEEGTERPCACLAHSADEPISMLDPKPTGTSSAEILEYLRELVAEDDEHQLYAIVYYATLHDEGQPYRAIVAECGERDGEAPVFELRYRKSKSGKLKLNEVEYVREEKNLWET